MRANRYQNGKSNQKMAEYDGETVNGQKKTIQNQRKKKENALAS